MPRWEQHEPGADAHREREAQRHAVGVEERQHRVHDLLAVAEAGDPGPTLHGVGHQVAVAEHGALGCSGGAARVLQQRGVAQRRSRMPLRDRAGIDDLLPFQDVAGGGLRRERRPRRARLRDRQAERQPLHDRQRPGEVDGDDVRRPDVAREVGDRVGDRVPHDRDRRAVVLELVPELARRVQRVVLDHDGAEPEHGVERHDVLRAVGQHERDPVARAHTEPSQPLGGLRDLLAELSVARLGAEELERDALPEPDDRVVDQVAERPRRLLDVVRYARGVVGEPWSLLVRIHWSPLPGWMRALAGRYTSRAPRAMVIRVRYPRPA
ncbi:MAG: hypothetical protein K0S05_2552 [Agromyces sp.]|nr:hypothetical protein [Agromyces sp.]